jgi:hypothetical protein
MRSGSNGDDTILDFTGGRFPGPLELFQIDASAIGQSVAYTICKVGIDSGLIILPAGEKGQKG